MQNMHYGCPTNEIRCRVPPPGDAANAERGGAKAVGNCPLVFSGERTPDFQLLEIVLIQCFEIYSHSIDADFVLKNIN